MLAGLLLEKLWGGGSSELSGSTFAALFVWEPKKWMKLVRPRFLFVWTWRPVPTADLIQILTQRILLNATKLAVIWPSFFQRILPSCLSLPVRREKSWTLHHMHKNPACDLSTEWIAPDYLIHSRCCISSVWKPMKPFLDRLLRMTLSPFSRSVFSLQTTTGTLIFNVMLWRQVPNSCNRNYSLVSSVPLGRTVASLLQTTTRQGTTALSHTFFYMKTLLWQCFSKASRPQALHRRLDDTTVWREVRCFSWSTGYPYLILFKFLSARSRMVFSGITALRFPQKRRNQHDFGLITWFFWHLRARC